MYTNIFNTQDLFNFKTHDRPSQEDFKDFYISLQQNHLPGEYRFINKHFTPQDDSWIVLRQDTVTVLSGTGNPDGSNGSSFMPLVSTPAVSGFGLFEIVGTGKNGGYNSLSNFFSYFDSQYKLTEQQQYNYLKDTILNSSTVSPGISGFQANAQFSVSLMYVLSTFVRSVYTKYNRSDWDNYSWIDDNILIDDYYKIFNFLFNKKVTKYYCPPGEYTTESGQICSFPAGLQYIPAYIAYDPILFNFETFLSRISYSVNTEIKTLVFSLSENVIPVGRAISTETLFYLIHLSGFEALATYTQETDPDYMFFDNSAVLLNRTIENSLKTFNTTYFKSPQYLSGSLIPTYCPFDLNINFSVGSVPLTADFKPGEYFYTNYFPYLSGELTTANLPRSDIFEGGIEPAITKCIKYSGAGNFYPIILSNVIDCFKNPAFINEHSTNIGAGVLFQKYATYTGTPDGYYGLDLIDGLFSPLQYYQGLSGYHPSSSSYQNEIYVDLVALTAFATRDLPLSGVIPSQQDDITIYTAKYFIPSSFYNDKPAVTSLYPNGILSGTTFYTYDPGSDRTVVWNLSSKIITAHQLSLSSYFNYNNGTQYSYFLVYSLPKYNFITAPFFNNIPDIGFNQPPSEDPDEAVFKHPLSLVDTGGVNLLSWYESVVTTPVTASQFIPTSVIEFNNLEPYAVLNTNYTLTYNNGVTAAQTLYSGPVNVDTLEASYIKRRNGKITPLSFLLYCGVNLFPQNLCYIIESDGEYTPIQDNYLNNLPNDYNIDNTYINNVSAIMIPPYLWYGSTDKNHNTLHRIWRNKTPQSLSAFYGLIANLSGGLASDHITLTQNPDPINIQEYTITTIPTIELSKGRYPYLYSALKDLPDLYINNDSQFDTFYIKPLSSLTNLLTNNSLDVCIFGGNSGVALNENLSATQFTFPIAGGSGALYYNTKQLNVFCDPVRIFNKNTNNFIANLSSTTYGLSTFSHFSNNTIIYSYENYLKPVSSYRSDALAISVNNTVPVDLTEITKLSLPFSEGIYMASTLYLYLCTYNEYDKLYWFYGKEFPSIKTIKDYFNINCDINIILSGSYYSAIEYTDYGNGYHYINIDSLVNTTDILVTERKQATLIGEDIQEITIPLVTFPLILPDYPS